MASFVLDDWISVLEPKMEKVVQFGLRVVAQQDFMISTGLGVIIGLILIYVGSGRAAKPSKRSRKKKAKAEDGDNYQPLQQQGNTTIGSTSGVAQYPGGSGAGATVRVPFINKERVLQKSEAFQKMLNITPEQVSEAVDMTNAEIEEEANAGRMSIEEGVTGALKVMDIFVYGGFVVFLFVSFNYWSNGDFGRMVNGMFPAETKSLRIYDYLQHWHAHGLQRTTSTA